MNKPLRSKGDWTPELLEEYYAEIEQIAVGEFGLDVYPNQIEIITANQMLDAYSTHALPVMYSHWRFGKSHVKNKNAYDKGNMGLAFEIVSNTNPCIAYIMEENSICMQALVTSHAAFGHNCFFKTNYMFKEWTDAEAIVDYLLYAKKYIEKCEEKYGSEAVEEFLDAAHSIERFGVDRYKRSAKTDLFKEAERLATIKFLEEHYDDVIHQTTPKKAVVDDPDADSLFDPFNKFKNMEPQENLLYFLEKEAPYLHTWQREILRIVRKISQYFYPQLCTKLINEGFATFMHYEIIHRLHEKGLVDDGFMLEFYDYHTAVISQPDYDHPYYKHIGINVYALGFRMFQDIKRICMNPTDEDREYFPDIAGNNDWIGTVKWIARNFRDESFVTQFLSPKIVRDFRLFAVHDEKSSNEIEITGIHNRSDFLHIRDKLSKMFDVSERIPNIQVFKIEPRTRKMILRHISSAEKVLEAEETYEVLHNLVSIWKFDIRLESVDLDDNVYDILDTDCEAEDN